MQKRYRVAAAAMALALAAAACGDDDDGSTSDTTAPPAQAEIGEGEGAVSILAWPYYAEDGTQDPNYDWVSKFEDDTGCEASVKSFAVVVIRCASDTPSTVRRSENATVTSASVLGGGPMMGCPAGGGKRTAARYRSRSGT